MEGNSGEPGAGGVRESGEERAGSGKEMQNVNFRYSLLFYTIKNMNPTTFFLLAFSFLRGFRKNVISEQGMI